MTDGLFGTESMERLRRRAEQAAAAGEETFAIPEAAAAAEFVMTVVPQGPLRDEANHWLEAGASYHALVRLTARAVLSLENDDVARLGVFVPKAAAELEPLLSLWPTVIAIPTPVLFKPLDLLALRAFPVHPLGLIAESTWADGHLCSPAEYFFHDADHARFKIREDLQLEGIEIPDAYEGGTTFDSRTKQHRIILPAAAGRIGSTLWDQVGPKREFASRLTAFAKNLGGPSASAAKLLLFEIFCEKSHALDPAVLLRELSTDTHVVKIRHKQSSGFYGNRNPGPATMEVLDEARLALKGML